MADQVEYTMANRGATHGDVTGRYYQWRPGKSIPAPEGEFRHLAAGSYTTRPLTPAPAPTTPPAPADEIDATVGAIAFATEHRIDLRTVTGTGKNGRITKKDVEALVEGEGE